MLIHVCPLSKVDRVVAQSGATRLVSLLSAGTTMTRPTAITAENHLLLAMNDIAELRDGMTIPGEAHVRRMLDFVQAADCAKPLAINCYAGVSRSTAAAYIVAIALAPSLGEMELAHTLRFLSPSATPNPRLIEVADAILGRQGRMIAAIRAIGRGADAFEGAPFALEI